MRKFILIAAVALLGTIGLSACNENDNGNGEQSAQADATRPSATAVDDAVKECRAKHPGSAPPAPAATTAPASGQTAAPASAQTASMATDQAAATASSEDDPCERTTIAVTVWRPYLQHMVTSNMGDVTNTPYVYFVPSDKYPENQGAIGRVQDQINTVVAATVLPGNMVAVAGPDSASSAQVLINAFQNAAAGSFKGVVVLFIGDKADEAAVQKALAPSGATFKFVQM